MARIALRNIKHIQRLKFKLRLQQAQIDQLIELTQLQEQTIQEMRDTNNIVASRNDELWDLFGDWYYVTDVPRPKEIYEFFDEVGLDPCQLPNRLSDVMEIRDLVKRLG